MSFRTQKYPKLPLFGRKFDTWFPHGLEQLKNLKIEKTFSSQGKVMGF